MSRHTDADGDGVADFAEQELAHVRPLRSAVSRPLTGETVKAALAAVGAVGKQIKTFDELAAGANTALAAAPAGLTPAGAAAFLATCAVESAWFRTTTEYGSGQRYAPYIGRTFVQLTWRENYLGFGRWCKNKGLVTDPDTFANEPATLSSFRWAWLGAVYYFEMHGLWRYANADNMLAVSQAVNGGDKRIGTSFVPNSWTERRAMYRVFLAANIAPPSTSTSTSAVTPALGTELVLNIPFTGTGSRRVFLDPPGAVVIERAFFSWAVDGPDGAQASCRVYPQHAGGGTGQPVDLVSSVRTDGTHTVDRPYLELPAGTDQITVQYSVPEGSVAYLVPAFKARP